MPVMDEFREEREAIRHGTAKQKYQYFKDYYRIPLIIILVALLFLGTLVYQIVSNRDPVFYAVMLNCISPEEHDWLIGEFADYAGIDTEKNDIQIDTGARFTIDSMDEDSYVTIQRLGAYSSIGQLDVMLGGGDAFAYFAGTGYFLDLRTLLTEEQLQKYEPYLYYIDAALEVNYDPTKSGSLLYADPRRPEEMEDPVPIGIYVDSSQKLKDAFVFQNAEDGIVLSVYSTTQHPDNAIAFLEYLLDETVS